MTRPSHVHHSDDGIWPRWTREATKQLFWLIVAVGLFIALTAVAAPE